MRHIKPCVKAVLQEALMSTHVPYSHFNDEAVVETNNGEVFAVIALEGVPFDTATNETLNQYKMQWHQALMGLGCDFSLVGTIDRRRVDVALAGQFTNALAVSINKAYQSYYQQQPMYHNTLYLSVIYKGELKKRKRWINQALQFDRDNAIQKLMEAVNQLMVSLAAFGPELLTNHQLMQFMRRVISPGRGLGDGASQTLPRAHLGYALATERLFVGEYLQWQGALSHHCRFGAMVSIKRYASDTAPIVLDSLLRLPGEYIATHSFNLVDYQSANKLLVRHQRKLLNVNDPGVSQIDALDSARDQLTSEALLFGYHHNSVMLWADSTEQLDLLIAGAVKCYQRAGITAVRETIGQEACYWAQLPGNHRYIARPSLISSHNFCDLFPLHNYRSGFIDGNHLGMAVTMAQTPAHTLMWLNLHSKGPKDNPATGHTTLVGGNGCGKTVMMCFLDAQLNRYGGSSWFFDRNRGAEIYIRASGGHYAILSPDCADTIQFNPLQMDGTAANRHFCKQWMMQLVLLPDELEVPDDVMQDIQGCVDYCFDQLAPEYRSLTHASRILPITFKRWSRLRRWLRADGSYPDGEYAYLFDNDCDALSVSKKMGFDMTHFLDHEPANVLTAVTMYLFYRLEQCLDGHLVSVFLDEAWQYLDNPYWMNKLKRWLPTLRKLNCHLVMATQSPHSITQSAISYIILDNVATQIYFANPQAKAEDYVAGFNLTLAEYKVIRTNQVQSRLFLYKQQHESALLRLDLSSIQSYLPVLSATQSSVEACALLRKRLGEHPDQWLAAFLQEACYAD